MKNEQTIIQYKGLDWHYSDCIFLTDSGYCKCPSDLKPEGYPLPKDMNTPNSQNKIECNACKISPNGGICFEHRTSSHSQTAFVNSQSEPKSACCGAEKGFPPRGNPPQGHKSELCGKACSKCGKDFIPVDKSGDFVVNKNCKKCGWEGMISPTINSCPICKPFVPESEKDHTCDDKSKCMLCDKKFEKPPTETPEGMTEFEKTFISDIYYGKDHGFSKDFLYNFIQHQMEQGRQEEIARIVKMIEAIDDSGGGSGRRLKIQLLDQLKH